MMQLRRQIIWIPLALAGALAAAALVVLPAYAQEAPHPAPYNYFGPDPHFGPGIADGPGSCYVDNLNGRVCRD
jgi:hypothetical protein